MGRPKSSIKAVYIAVYFPKLQYVNLQFFSILQYIAKRWDLNLQYISVRLKCDIVITLFLGYVRLYYTCHPVIRPLINNFGKRAGEKDNFMYNFIL